MGVNCDTCSDTSAVDLRDERIRQKIQPIRELAPPFKQLPNLHVTAVLLCYLGYEDDIRYILNNLSRSTKKYYL